MTLYQDLLNAGCKVQGTPARFQVSDEPTAREILAEWDAIPLDAYREGSHWYLDVQTTPST